MPLSNSSHVCICSRSQVSVYRTIGPLVLSTWIVQSLFLNLKFQASGYLLYLHSLVCVGPGWKPHCWFSHETAAKKLLCLKPSSGRLALRKHAHVIYRFFLSCKNGKISVEYVLYFSYLCSKHRLWVHIRTTSVRLFEQVTTI